MNAAYKWYSLNSNIIQFYSGYSDLKNVTSPIDDNTIKTVECAYNYSEKVIDFQPDINLN